jgi:von Willebrand factor type A domain
MATTMAALLAAAAMAAPSGAVSGGVSASASCTPATNIEAIIDDSYSMGGTDPDRLRVQAMGLLINTLPAQTLLGAVEFGSEGFETAAANSIFPPQPVGPNGTTMKTALEAVVNSDSGATDYNAAFAKADADDPNAQARIFLTDGGHNADTYNEAHLAHNVPTYVIGFGTGLTLEEDRARLQKIAADTGGQVFQLDEASQLQPVMNKIGAALTCQTPPLEFEDLLKQGQSKTHTIAVGASTKVLQIALSWASPSDVFRLARLKLIVKGKVVAAGRPKIAKLKVKKTSSATFAVAKVSGLRKGTLRFAVKAAKIGSGEPKVKLTTQVGRGSGK